ncbi:MAG: hypothetical protein DRP59_05630 [Spirochaetes bacterium]|nr:MAG: hypothetical protein DRP59_05630 [Spirochaetota bacterium]
MSIAKRPSVRRVFFNIRIKIIQTNRSVLPVILFIFLVFPQFSFSEEYGCLFTLDLGNRYRLVERQNLRVRENGVYRGFLYREYRAFLRTSDTVRGRYKGEYYLLENMKRNASLIAKAVDNEYKVSFSINDRGIMLGSDDNPVPIHRGFPAFSAKPVKAGASWDVSGSDLVFDSKGNSARVPFLCRYVFRGEETYMNRPVAVIDAQYALRYDERSYGYKEGSIKGINGSRKSVIMLYRDAAGGIFINSRLKQRIIYSSGGSEETEGIILTWYNGISASAIEASDALIADSLNRLKSEPEKGYTDKAAGGSTAGTVGTTDGGTGSVSGSPSLLHDVSVEESEKGLVLKIQNIHFLPNSPVILPEEKGRLDSISSVLKGAEGRMFLVTGHTADVGSQASQQELSVQRAKTIVDELVKRGFSANRFMYEGKGSSESIASNDTKEGRAKNRRVEITILY